MIRFGCGTKLAMETKALGQRLKRLRVARGLSQIDMAELLGFGPQGHPIVSKIESGKRELRAAELGRWCSTCGVSVDDVLGNGPLMVEIEAAS